MDAIKEFFLSPTGLGYIAMALVILGVVLKTMLPKKADTIAKIEGLVFKAFNYAEKAIPDALQGDTKMARALHKADTFLKAFVKAYKERYGADPTESEKSKAVDLAERLVFTKNAKK